MTRPALLVTIAATLLASPAAFAGSSKTRLLSPHHPAGVSVFQSNPAWGVSIIGMVRIGKRRATALSGSMNSKKNNVQLARHVFDAKPSWRKGVTFLQADRTHPAELDLREKRSLPDFDRRLENRTVIEALSIPFDKDSKDVSYELEVVGIPKPWETVSLRLRVTPEGRQTSLQLGFWTESEALKALEAQTGLMGPKSRARLLTALRGKVPHPWIRSHNAPWLELPLVPGKRRVWLAEGTRSVFRATGVRLDRDSARAAE